MNNLKIKRLLATGILGLTLTGCVTPQASAAEIPTTKVVQNKSVNSINMTTSLIYTAKMNKNTAKMKETLMKIFHRVNKTPYVFAGDSIRYGWDCSGMVVWMYEQFGLTLPHSATAQAKIGNRVAKPKIGDIVIFGYKGYKSFYHSAIYIGKGKVVNANSGAGTTIIEPLTNYKNNRIAYVRVVPTI
jgi:cell wall-associated NlpC family hydrolase